MVLNVGVESLIILILAYGIFQSTNPKITQSAFAEALNDPVPVSRHHERALEFIMTDDAGKLQGACSYNSTWSGYGCHEYRGAWGYRSMKLHCSKQENSEYFRQSCLSRLPPGDDLAGLCNVVVQDVPPYNRVKVASTVLMVTESDDCESNKMICETFIGGTFEPYLSSTCQGYETTRGPTFAPTESFDDFSEETSIIYEPACDQPLTSLATTKCSERSMIVSFMDDQKNCGAALTLADASHPPTLKVIPTRIDPSSLYSLVMVDTTDPRGDSIVHPILHYGAVNIPGSALISGFSLEGSRNQTENEADIFTSYRGPSPPKSSDPWAPPRVDRTLFVYEFMLGLQSEGEIEVPEIESNTNFNVLDFFMFDVGSQNGLVASSYFYSGWCVVGANQPPVAQRDWTCSSTNATEFPPADEILIESFSDPQFQWITVDDPVLGGSSYSSVAVQNGFASFEGNVSNLPILNAPGFVQMESRGGEYPDVSCCEALKLVVTGMEDYSGYVVSFGTKMAKRGFFSNGFKSNFEAPPVTLGEVIIPFEDFSVEWDERTGVPTVTCTEDSSVCPDVTTLEDMQTISIRSQGVEGSVYLKVQSISAIGCTQPVREESTIEYSSGHSATVKAAKILLLLPLFVWAMDFNFLSSY